MKFYLSLPLNKAKNPVYDMQNKQRKTVKEGRFTEDPRSQDKI